MKKTFLITFFSFLACSCSNDDDLNDQLIGNWKLVRAEQYGINNNGGFELFNIDYSNSNIIYSFLSTEILIVEGGENIGYTTGEYNYVFGFDCLGSCVGNEQEILLVKINNGSKWTYSLESGIMILGNSYVDGPDLYFTRE